MNVSSSSEGLLSANTDRKITAIGIAIARRRCDATTGPAGGRSTGGRSERAGRLAARPALHSIRLGGCCEHPVWALGLGLDAIDLPGLPRAISGRPNPR